MGRGTSRADLDPFQGTTSETMETMISKHFVDKNRDSNARVSMFLTDIQLILREQNAEDIRDVFAIAKRWKADAMECMQKFGKQISSALEELKMHVVEDEAAHTCTLAPLGEAEQPVSQKRGKRKRGKRSR